jgi:hypothetical protein
LWYWTLNSGPLPSTLPALFCDGCFWDMVSWTVCLSWFQTVILLISASWGARITGVSHQHLAPLRIFDDFASMFFWISCPLLLEMEVTLTPVFSLTITWFFKLMYHISCVFLHFMYFLPSVECFYSTNLFCLVWCGLDREYKKHSEMVFRVYILGHR